MSNNFEKTLRFRGGAFRTGTASLISITSIDAYMYDNVYLFIVVAQ